MEQGYYNLIYKQSGKARFLINRDKNLASVELMLYKHKSVVPNIQHIFCDFFQLLRYLVVTI